MPRGNSTTTVSSDQPTHRTILRVRPNNRRFRRYTSNNTFSQQQDANQSTQTPISGSQRSSSPNNTGVTSQSNGNNLFGVGGGIVHPQTDNNNNALSLQEQIPISNANGENVSERATVPSSLLSQEPPQHSASTTRENIGPQIVPHSLSTTAQKPLSDKTQIDTVPVGSVLKEDVWDPNHWTASLHCCVCFEFYEEAYVLTCGHSFCHGCMEMMVSTDHKNKYARRPKEFTPVVCPSCRYTMPYQHYVRYAPRNRAIEAAIDAWKASDERNKLYVSKVERGIQIGGESNGSMEGGGGKAEEQTPPVHAAIQTDPWPPKKIVTEVGLQVSLHVMGQSKAMQTTSAPAVQTRNMLVQTKKFKYRNKLTQTKETKSSTSVCLQTEDVGPALSVPSCSLSPPPIEKVNCSCFPRGDNADGREGGRGGGQGQGAGERTKATTRETQTPKEKKKKVSSVRSQTELQSCAHLKLQKGDDRGPWMACTSSQPHKFPRHPSLPDPVLISLVIWSIFIQLDWRDIASKFVTDVPTILSDDYYTSYTLRLMLDSLVLCLSGMFSVLCMFSCLIRRGLAT